MTHKHICNYRYLVPPFGYLQTFISAYFQKHEILCFFIFSFLKVRTGQGFFHAKEVSSWIMRMKRELGHLEWSLLLWALLPVRPSRTRGSWSSSFLGLHCLGLAPLLKTCMYVVLLYFICFQNSTALAALWRIQFCWWLLLPGMQPSKICCVNRGDPDKLGVFHNWSTSGRHCNTPPPYPENPTLITEISYWSQDMIQQTQTHCTFSRTSHDFL